MQRPVLRTTLFLVSLLTLAFGLVPRGANAMLILDALVTPDGGGIFAVDLTVTNGLAEDVILLSVIDAPVADALVTASLEAPAGYAAVYDAGLGIVDLVEDTLLFGAGQSVGGFSFITASAPGPGVFETFEAFTAGLNFVNGTVQVSFAPEPAASAMLLLGLIGLLSVQRVTRSVALGRGAAAAAKRASLLALATSFAAGTAQAASHSDAPLIKQDPQANITDVYAFVGTRFDDPTQKVLNVITTVRPFSEPGDGAIYDRFASDARYSMHLTDPFSGETARRYDFQFSSVNPSTTPGLKNPTTILSYGLGGELGPILTPGDARQNYTQTYAVTVTHGSAPPQTLAAGLVTPPPNLGRNTTPDYNDTLGSAVSGATTFEELDAYTKAAVLGLPTGEVVFAGPREDGFFADIPGIFDLLDDRILDNDGDPDDGLGQDGNGVDGFKGYNVLAYGIQIPVDTLSDVPGFPLIGVYASVSRQRIQLRSSFGNPRTFGPHVQVNRMGNPLFNEAFVALKDKDSYNRLPPTKDASKFSIYAREPELARLVNAVFGTAFPETGNLPLEAIFIPDVLRVDTSTAPVPLAGQSNFRRLSFIDGDIVSSPEFGVVPGGWPNGRRFGDDVIDIALTAVAAGQAPVLGDNVNENDQVYHQVFPYAATPHSGTQNRKDPFSLSFPE